MKKRNMIIGKMLIATVFLCTSKVSISAEQCSAVLGLRDVTTTATDQSSINSFLRYYCDRNSTSWSSANKTGFGLELPIPDLPPIGLDFNNSNSSSSAYRREVCERVATGNYASNEFRQKVETIGEGVVAAWEKCMNSDKYGFYAWLEANYQHPMDVVIAGKYKGDREPYTVKVKSVILPTSLLCKPHNLNDGQPIGNSTKRIKCQRLNTDGGTIVVQSEADQPSIDLPSVRDLGCHDHKQVIEALYSQLFEGTAAIGNGGEVPQKLLARSSKTLQRTRNIQDLARDMIQDDDYALWIFKSSLVETKRVHPGAPQPETAYSWMANSLYASIFGKLPDSEELDDFKTKMPKEKCSLPTSPSSTTICFDKFKYYAEELIDSVRFSVLHSDQTIFFRSRLLPPRTAKYCGAASDCLTNRKWCRASAAR